MFALNKEYINQTLKEERLWKVGESNSFSFDDWELTLKKEEEIYNPYNYSIIGNHKSGSSWNRRYVTMEKAFLHILNRFNENEKNKNRYYSLKEALIYCKEI